MKTVGIFCSSSRLTPASYCQAARELACLLVSSGWRVATGAGATGLMGAVADEVLRVGGSVVGVIPDAMVRQGWAHPRIADVRVTADLVERKRLMIGLSDALVALPGGSGTLDELLEAYELRKLGMLRKPVVLLNTGGFYDALIGQLQKAVDEGLMTSEHLSLLCVCGTPGEVVRAVAAPQQTRTLGQAGV